MFTDFLFLLSQNISKQVIINYQWITKVIINSCKRKNDLFLLTRNNNDLQLKEHYKRYSKILSQVVRTAKILHHNNQIAQSKNTIKTTWNIIKNETGRNNTVYNNINSRHSDREQNKRVNAEIFNKYFITVAKNISCRIKESNKQNLSYTKDSSYLSQVFNQPFPNLVFQNTSTSETEKIIHSLPWKNSWV